MFKLSTKKSYKRNIKIDVPHDMGKTERQTFVMEFKQLSVSETKDLIEEAQNERISDEDMLRRYVLGWDGIVDEDGNPLDFTTSNLEAVMDVPYVRKAVMAAFIEDVFGKEAVRKN